MASVFHLTAFNGVLEGAERASLIAQLVKNPPAMLGSILGLGRSPGVGKGYPLHYSGLENSMHCIVYGVAELGMTERLSLGKGCTKASCFMLTLFTVKRNFNF